MSSPPQFGIHYFIAQEIRMPSAYEEFRTPHSLSLILSEVICIAIERKLFMHSFSNVISSSNQLMICLTQTADRLYYIVFN